MSIINLFSPNWNIADSYGRIAHEVSRGFESSGYYVNRLGDDAPKQDIKPCFGGIFLGYPTDYQKYIDGQISLSGIGARVAVTMFESTRLPDGWGDALNQCDAVVVPAQFLVDVFRQSGVGAPMSVAPLGMSEAFTKTVHYRTEVHTPKEPFAFICIADRGTRKNWDKVVVAFFRAFGDDERFKLIIKARKFPINFTNSNIEVITEDYSDEQMADLYRKCHVMVFPSSGEGFGLPPREFAATGGVALVTNWGGMADDVHQWSIPLPVTMTDAWKDKPEWFGKLGQWADVDVAILADQMRHIADHYVHYASFGIRAAGFVRSHYRWETFTKHVQGVWENAIAIKEKAHGNNGHRETNPAAENGRLVNIVSR